MPRRPDSARANQSRSAGFAGSDPLEDALDFQSGPEPAATVRAMQDSPEGEHLYREIKSMELESMQDPDPEDTIVQTPLADIEDVPDILPIKATGLTLPLDDESASGDAPSPARSGRRPVRAEMDDDFEVDES